MEQQTLNKLKITLKLTTGILVCVGIILTEPVNPIALICYPGFGLGSAFLIEESIQEIKKVINNANKN